MVPGTETCPGRQVPVRRKARDLGPYFGEYHLRRAPTNVRRCLEAADRLLKRAQPFLDLTTQTPKRLVKVGDVGKMLADHEPVVVTDPSGEGWLQLRSLLTQTALGQVCQVLGVACTSRDRLQNRSAGCPQDIGGYGRRLLIRSFQRLLETIHSG